MAAEPQLTPACELAFDVARHGITASPPVEAPAALRPFLDHRPPSRRDLRAAHRALDVDAGFRRRVAAQAATDEFVGRAGWLFLHRPDGWDAELSRLTGRERPSTTRTTPNRGAAAVPGIESAVTAPAAEGPAVADEVEDATTAAVELELVEDAEPAAVEVEPVTEVEPVADPELIAEAEPVAGDVEEAVEAVGPVIEQAADAVVWMIEGPAADVGVPVPGSEATETVPGAERVAAPEGVDDGAVGSADASAGLERELQALRSLVEGLVADGGVLAGATIRHLEEQLATLTGERDELAAALTATEADRDRAIARAVTAGDLLAAADARLAEVTASRVDADDRLARVLVEHADVQAGRQAQLADLAGLLAQAEADRAALTADLARTSAHVADVRGVFERAVQQAADEVVASLEPALAAAGGSVQALAGSIESARLGAEQLAAEPAAGDTAPLPPVVEPDTAGCAGGPRSDAGTLAPEAGPDLLTQELSDFSKDLSDALAPYFTDPTAPARPAAGPLERALAGWSVEGAAADGGIGDTAPWPATTGGPVTDGPAADGPREVWSNPADRPRTARRPVDVPAEVLDDALSTARFLAATPDVVLLIDGDAVGAIGWPTLTVAEQRDALVSYLADLTGTSGAAADVIFGGDLGGAATLPLSDLVRVRLTAAGVPTGQAVVALIDTYPADWPVVVVGDVADLAAPAERAGATVLSTMGLLDLFIAP